MEKSIEMTRESPNWKTPASGHCETVAVVVVTYNRKDLLAQCLDALLAQTRRPDTIYVIDNASTDGTPVMMAECYPGARFERLPENTGGAGGFRHGMRRAHQDGHDRIWIMDDDVRPHRRCLEELLFAAKEYPRGILLGVREDPEGKLCEASCILYDLARPWVLPGQHQEAVSAHYADTRSLPAQMELANMSFEGPLIPRAVLDEVGLPDLRFFLYGDDTDFAIRCRNHGFRVILIREGRVTRLLAGTAAHLAIPAFKVRFMIRNPLWINRLHGETWWVRNVRSWYWALLILSSNLLRLELIRRPARWKAVCRGLREGLSTALITQDPAIE